MSDDVPATWTDPWFVATVVGVLAVGALYAYSASAKSGPNTHEVTVVLLAVFGPMTIAHEVARRWLQG